MSLVVLPNLISKKMVVLAYKVLMAKFNIDSKKDVRAFFNEMRQKFLDWNSVQIDDERYAKYEKEINDLFSSKVKEG